MSQTPKDPAFGGPSADMWNDVPLFREIQRVLSSSHGPVNWELARQVVHAVVAEGNGAPAFAFPPPKRDRAPQTVVSRRRKRRLQ